MSGQSKALNGFTRELDLNRLERGEGEGREKARGPRGV